MLPNESAKSEAQQILDDYNAVHSALCRHCSKRLAPQNLGRIRHHTRDVFVGTFLRSERCPGSGLPPRDRR